MPDKFARIFGGSKLSEPGQPSATSQQAPGDQKPVVSQPFNYSPPPPSRPAEPTMPAMTPVAPPQPNLPPAALAPPEFTGPRGPTKKERYKSIISTLLILIAAPLVALGLTAYVFQSFEVDGPSMESTLQNNDRLIVLKLPKNISRLQSKVYIPQRGDIIIFSRPATAYNEEKQLIKRVIAVPGERVVIKDGLVTVYNKDDQDGFYPDHNPEYKDSIETTSGNVDLTVPENEVFVLGDNRNNSLDSRSFGTVPAHDIVGKLVLRIFPFNKINKY